MELTEQELSVQDVLDFSLENAKQANVPQLAVLLLNIRGLEANIKLCLPLLRESRATIKLADPANRAAKLHVKELSRTNVSGGKEVSKAAKNHHVVRDVLTRALEDTANFREALRSDRKLLNVFVEALREFYKQNPNIEPIDMSLYVQRPVAAAEVQAEAPAAQ